VDEARRRFVRGADAMEVIVVDNASTDGTGELAAARGCVVVSVEQRLIAAARNGGARVARGRILCFVDADTRIHPETFNEVLAALDGDDVVAGATGVRLERWSLGIAMTWALVVPLVLLTGMDTGVVFCRRADFDAVGGYDERREMAEDVAFLWALRRLGRSRGEGLVRLTTVKAVASMRKFDRHGDWHYFTQVMPLAVPALLRPSMRTRLARRYWYGDDR
jgi:glycosyltransferase involved in cell wall biosynthesis